MVKTKAFIDWELQSYLIGKGIGVFVLTYTTMNWWFYRRTREEMEKKEKEDEKK